MPSPIDPSGFQISVVVRTSQGAFPLWMNGAISGESTIYYNTRAEEVEYRDLPIVESVQVDIGMGLIGKVSVELAAPYDLGLELLNSAIFAIGSVIDVQIGYPRIGKFLPWFSTMASKPSISINPNDGLTASLNGEGGAFAANRGGASEDFSGSYASIIKRIADQESNKWNLDIRGSGRDDDPLFVSRGSVSQGNRTDWAFVQYLCRMANYDAFIIPDETVRGRNVLRVQQRRAAMGGQPRYTFISRGRCDFINSFPMLSFDSSAEGVWLPPRDLHSVDINIRDRETPAETVVRPETTDVPVLPGRETPGAGAGELEGTVVATEPVPRDARGAGRRVVHPAHSPERPSEVLIAMATEAMQQGGLNASFTTIGIPDLFPGENVRLEGIGVFSGNYVIESVAHSAAPGDWNMTVKLLGSGVDARGITDIFSHQWGNYNSLNPQQRQEAEGGGTTLREVADSIQATGEVPAITPTSSE